MELVRPSNLHMVTGVTGVSVETSTSITPSTPAAIFNDEEDSDQTAVIVSSVLGVVVVIATVSWVVYKCVKKHRRSAEATGSVTGTVSSHSGSVSGTVSSHSNSLQSDK